MSTVMLPVSFHLCQSILLTKQSFQWILNTFCCHVCNQNNIAIHWQGKKKAKERQNIAWAPISEQQRDSRGNVAYWGSNIISQVLDLACWFGVYWAPGNGWESDWLWKARVWEEKKVIFSDYVFGWSLYRLWSALKTGCAVGWLKSKTRTMVGWSTQSVVLRLKVPLTVLT